MNIDTRFIHFYMGSAATYGSELWDINKINMLQEQQQKEELVKKVLP